MSGREEEIKKKLAQIIFIFYNFFLEVSFHFSKQDGLLWTWNFILKENFTLNQVYSEM